MIEPPTEKTPTARKMATYEVHIGVALNDRLTIRSVGLMSFARVLLSSHKDRFGAEVVELRFILGQNLRRNSLRGFGDFGNRNDEYYRGALQLWIARIDSIWQETMPESVRMGKLNHRKLYVDLPAAE